MDANEYFEQRLKHVAEIVEISRRIATVAQFGETNLATVPSKELWALQDAIQKLDAVKATVDRERGLEAMLYRAKARDMRMREANKRDEQQERKTNCNHDFGAPRLAHEIRRCWKCGVLEK